MMRGFQILSTVAILYQLVHAVDEDAAKGQTCFPIENEQALNMTWVSSVSTFYRPASSLLDQYRQSKDLLQRPFADISQEEIDTRGCFEYSFKENGTIEVDAFAVPPFNYLMTRILPRVWRFEAESDIRSYNGTFYVGFTDNESYFVTVMCTNDWEMTWGLYSTSINPENLTEILNNVEKLGFKRNLFTRNTYTTCEDVHYVPPVPEDDGKGNKYSLPYNFG